MCDCLQANLPVLVVTNDPRRLSQTLQVLSRVHGTKLRRILLNERSDTSQLLGCFEQTSDDYSQFLRQILSRHSNVHDVLKLQYELAWASEERKAQVLLDFSDKFGFADLSA